MENDGYTVFSFSWGGFFANSHGFKIEETSEGYIGTETEMFADDPRRSFKVSERDVENLRMKLRNLGADEWFSRYENYNVLDGVQWGMTLDGTEHYGSNSFPPNFTSLSNYLAEKFDCPGLHIEEAFEDSFPENPDPIAHIAEYHTWMGDPNDKLEQKRIASLDENELEEERLSLNRTHSQMLHDLDILVRRKPELIDYQEIVEKSGVGFNLDEMRSADLSDLDAETILAMMIYIYRADRFDGWSENFLDCMQDGTFKRWLARLADLIEYPVL